MTDFEQIYRAYFTDVYRYVYRLSKDRHTAEEITGETFFKAMRGLKRFRGGCDIRVWLCQIAKNEYYNDLKKRGRVDHVGDELLKVSSPESSVENRLVSQLEAERIRHVLHVISEPYKEVFMWRIFAELSFRQIGQIFGKTENWACVTFHRAKSMIKERLEACKDE